jgi:hypothetical protein
MPLADAARAAQDLAVSPARRALFAAVYGVARERGVIFCRRVFDHAGVSSFRAMTNAQLRAVLAA